MRDRRGAARAALACASLAAVAALNACGTNKDPQVPGPPSAVIQPTRGIHLRVAFDDNATSYVGRFVPDNLPVEQVDETAAAQTRCSEFYGYNVVNTNQEFDEVAYASTRVGGAIGIKPFAAVSGSSDKGSSVRVHYTLTKRMQVTVKDAAGLQRCCAAASDQCSKQVIGEFLLGSGEVYQGLGSKAELEASGMAKQFSGEVNYKDEYG
jgi:hypothetical protein